jgi:hypothetical protein
VSIILPPRKAIVLFIDIEHADTRWLTSGDRHQFGTAIGEQFSEAAGIGRGVSHAMTAF